MNGNAGNDTLSGGDGIVIDLIAEGSIDGLAVSNAESLFNAAEDISDGVLIALGEGHWILPASLTKDGIGFGIFFLV